MIEERIKELREKIAESTADLENLGSEQLKEIRAEYLGKTGIIPSLMKELGKLPKEERPEMGKHINLFRDEAVAHFDKCEAEIAARELARRYDDEKVDITLPAKSGEVGALHPVTLVRDELIRVFVGMGFEVFEGFEIEDDYHNFTALNTPDDHPARDKQDSFYITDDILLRTQTSTGQIRVMEQKKPPIKVVSPGRVFRADDDATHSPMFHQIEGMVVDKNVTLSDLQGTLTTLAKAVFSPDTKTRFRPSYFPFTEPSVEVDISCFECGGCGCRLCKGTGWIEILGAGVINRHVLENCGIDPDEYTGLAFGAGIERIAMLKYGINNIHLLYEGDLRFHEQFKD